MSSTPLRRRSGDLTTLSIRDSLIGIGLICIGIWALIALTILRT